MTETEGVIKFHLDYRSTDPVATDLSALNAWRTLLHKLGLIGQAASRYLGYGYGNVSMRDPRVHDRFIISGSQTGGISTLQKQHYVSVEHCDTHHNRVRARGPIRPSSESLTHAVIYQMDTAAGCVLHVHDPVLWRYGLDSALPQTSPSVDYGTPQMAEEVARLFADNSLSATGILIMAGHEDGVISFGNDFDQAGYRMIDLWLAANGHPGQAEAASRR